MALVPVDLKVFLYASDECDSLFIIDETGLYSSDNTGGYNLPAGATVNSVTTVTVTLTYTQLSVDLVYVFTVLNGTITACTISFAGAAPTSIFSDLTSTVWPFTGSNPFELTKDYGVTLPDLDDMVYEVTYQVEGSYLSNDFDYSTDDQELIACVTCCCISKALINNVNFNDVTTLSPPMIAQGYLMTAQAANDDEDTDKANEYLIRAKAVCDGISGCGCGC